MTNLALHGFLGQGADWEAFAAAAGVAMDTPTLPGHGPRPDPVPHHFTGWVAWVCQHLARLPGPVHLLGYSMGGRLALATALAEANSGRVASLTLLGAHPGLLTPKERWDREQADCERAARLESAGLATFLDEWYRMPLFAPARAALGRRRLMERRRGGRPEALAAALRTVSTGRMPNLRPGLHHLRIPVLVLAGLLDEKFHLLGRDLAAAIPGSRFAAVPDAGHSLLVEAPAQCAALWTEFIAQQSLSINREDPS